MLELQKKTMKHYSKPLGKLLDFKQQFFKSNDSQIEEIRKIASLYVSQPRRKECKNCGLQLHISRSECFKKFGVDYCLCARCGHCNGLYEDTEVFCRTVYTADHSKNISENYSTDDLQQFEKRVHEVYIPKAQFLIEALAEIGQPICRLADFGAGAGYFVSAAMNSGFNDIIGYEPSETLVSIGNSMIGSNKLVQHDLSEIVTLIERSDATVASFIGVIEHVQNPREILKALRKNDNIKYVFFSVPLFSPAVVIESVFDHIMPRHLVADHTHLYTERSIQYFCNEFGFNRQAEWWFGLDICDLFRNIMVSIEKSSTSNAPLQKYWGEQFMPLIDDLQSILDKAHLCSEVHMVLTKK
jgi:hypothetical protein